MIGLQKITVPLREDELTLENITEYLQSVYSDFYLNSQKIRENYNFYKGEHSVLQKKRRYEDDEINIAGGVLASSLPGFSKTFPI